MAERTRRAAHDRADGLRRLSLLLRYIAKRPHPLQDVCPTAERGVNGPVWTEPRRRLHHAGETRRLAQAKLLRALPKPAVRRRLYPYEV